MLPFDHRAVSSNAASYVADEVEAYLEFSEMRHEMGKRFLLKEDTRIYSEFHT